ncbi:MAG: FtsX-like permease family protein [Halanaerobiales bacterium]|nr:FtsX-like permease family protein [Halanaerobiales bacterium]
MKYLLKLAYKNLARNRLRTIVSIIAITFAVMVVIFARGFILGMINETYSDTIQYDTGHIKIIDKDYQIEGRIMSLTETVSGYHDNSFDQLISKISNIDDVNLVLPRIKFGAITTNEEELINMIGWGVTPDKEVDATDIDQQIVEGRMPEKNKMEIVMGTELLNKLNKKLGDKVTLVFNNSFSSLNGATFEIVGQINSPLKMLNDTIFYIPIDQAQRLLLLEDQATEILVFANDRLKTDDITIQIKEMFKKIGLDKYMVIPYTETGGLIGWLELAKVMYNFIYVFLVVLASFVVINTMIMIVNERTKEIGMMTALGLEKRDILYLFLIEGSIMGGLGSFIGALLGGLITNVISKVGIDFGSTVEGFSSDLLFSSTIYPVFSVGNMVFGFFVGLIVVTVACLIPARRAAKLEPTDALKEF